MALARRAWPDALGRAHRRRGRVRVLRPRVPELRLVLRTRLGRRPRPRTRAAVRRRRSPRPRIRCRTSSASCCRRSGTSPRRSSSRWCCSRSARWWSAPSGSARRCTRAPVGALAAAIVVTRVPLLNYGVRGYLDLPTVAFVVWAAVLEARSPRRGVPVFVLLALAGCCDPRSGASRSPTGCGGRSGTRTGRERLRMLALALAAPVIWFALRLGSSPATRSGRCTGRPSWRPSSAPDRAGRAARGDAAPPRRDRAAARADRRGDRRRRRARLPAPPDAAAARDRGAERARVRRVRDRRAAAARPLPVPVVGDARAARVAGRARLDGDADEAALPALQLDGARAACCCSRFAVVFPLQQVDRLLDLRTDIADRDQVAGRPARAGRAARVAQRAIDACRPVYVPNHRPIPELAYWTDTRADGHRGDRRSTRRPTASTSRPPTTTSRSLSVLDPRDPRPLGAAVPSPGRRPAELGSRDRPQPIVGAVSAGCPVD